MVVVVVVVAMVLMLLQRYLSSHCQISSRDNFFQLDSTIPEDLTSHRDSSFSLSAAFGS